MTNDPASLPDPNGPPLPAPPSRGKHAGAFVLTTFLIACGGAAAFLVSGTTSERTMGALRSQRIKWEERRREIQDVQQQYCLQTPDDTDSGDARRE
jgi:hypothetical protein